MHLLVSELHCYVTSGSTEGGDSLLGQKSSAFQEGLCHAKLVCSYKTADSTQSHTINVTKQLQTHFLQTNNSAFLVI